MDRPTSPAGSNPTDSGDWQHRHARRERPTSGRVVAVDRPWAERTADRERTGRTDDEQAVEETDDRPAAEWSARHARCAE